MSDLSQKNIFRKLVALLLGNGISQIINTLFILILVRIFSEEQYAVYRLGNQIIVTLAPFFVFGLPMTISMFIPKYKEQVMRMRFVMQTIALLFLLGMIGSILLHLNQDVIYRIFGNEKLLDYLWVFSVSFFSEVVFSYFPFYMTSENKNRKLAISVTLLSLLKISSIIVAMAMGNSFEVFMYVFAFSSLIKLVYVIIEPIYHYKVGLKSFKRIDSKEQLKESLPIGMTNVVAAFSRNLGSNLVAMRFNISQFAIYVTGAFEVPLISVLRNSITGAVLPNFSQTFSKDNQESQNQIIHSFKKTVALSGIIILPLMIGLITYSRGAISLLFPGFEQSNYIFKVFMLLLPTQIANFSTLLLVSGKQKMVLLYSLMGIGVNVLAFYLLANTLGFFFVAFSTVLSEYTQLTLILFEVKKSYNQKSIFTALPINLFSKVLISNIMIFSSIFFLGSQFVNPNVPFVAVVLGGVSFILSMIVNSLFLPETKERMMKIIRK